MVRTLPRTMAIAAVLLLSSTLASADDFHPIPNSVKYKDSSVPNAKGSSGAASIEVRALFNKDQSTDVEVTTGTFDEPSASTATIKHVHLEYNGQVRDFTGNDGNTFSARGLSGLAPGAIVNVHANVKDLNGGNQNINVAVTVKKRPDLTFVSIRSTQNVMAGMPVDVVATIHEQNLQSGARTDCVGYVNGVEVDRAANIWVDAGGTVDCVLSPAFANPGQKDIKVVLENVRPGDWDTADNQVYAMTRVHAYNEEADFWTATARDETYTYYTRYYSANSEQVSSNSGWRASASVSATQREVLASVPMTMNFKATTDGATLVDLHNVPLGRWSGDERESCASNFNGAIRLQICTFNFPWGTGYTQFSAAVNNADVTYYSRYWSVYYDANGNPDVYTYEGAWREQNGDGQRLGNSVAMRVSVTDGTRTLWAEPFVNLAASEYHDGHNVCWEWGGCEEYHRDLVLKFGTASGGLNN
ncbi:MAG TPA: hypothetical protein VM733_17995 [Thermoanaerobaculia bacterium]|nr:hypothetical protein [Thermoanaerobaculia bacterium]